MSMLADGLAVVVGLGLVVTVLADMVNTLVTTQTSRGRFWLTILLYGNTWTMVRTIGRLLPKNSHRERLYATFAPVSVLLLLVAWVVQQIIGWALVWWGLGGVHGLDGFADALYYSGVVYFTLGFGEIVPGDVVPRLGALVEAFSGVLTTALVIGYLPALYSAYSEREQKLLTLDDGTEERITPTNLVLARCPDGDPRALDHWFEGWEAWVAQVMETHTSFPMLILFRSQHPGQSWITALGLVTDAALHMELMEGAQGRPSYWLIRRSTRLLQMLSAHADLTGYRDGVGDSDDGQFRDLYDHLAQHGFPVRAYDEALAHTTELRNNYVAELEYLIDTLEAPRGFWGHVVGHRMNDEHAHD
ncbi:MAG: two pore domain potassium channel family protein [Actinomycetia bacterium]|nr:two pore domain potassium channel family protein [Actinomycetes bacterium]